MSLRTNKALRKKFLRGNWKRNNTIKEGLDFCDAVKENDLAREAKSKGVRLGIAPSFVALRTIRKHAHGLIVAAQDCHYADHGAYTSSVSVPRLEEIGVDWAIIGHSEKRAYEGENYILRGEGKKKILECFDTSKLKEAAMDNKEDLAWDLVNFMKDFDTYSFVDDYDSDEDAVEQIKSDLSTKFGIESIKTMLNSIKEDADEESYDLEALESLLARLDTFSLEEEAGTQASDIASKVDYSFQSAPTTAKKRRKYLPVEIKELDESTYLNLTGFIKDVDGLYKRGNYVVVKETATDKIKVIHKNKLYEAENIEAVGNTKIAEYIEKKLNDRFPNRFKIKSGNVDDAFGIVITDSQNHTAGDLIDVTDFLNALMKYLKYDKTDYEIDYKGNHLIMAIYTNKTTTKADVA